MISKKDANFLETIIKRFNKSNLKNSNSFPF